MKEIIIIGLAVVCLLTLGVDLFFLDSLVEGSQSEARKVLWIDAGIIYIILMIPPYFMMDMARRQKAVETLRIGGLVAMDFAKYIAMGFLLFVGWRLATVVF